MGSHVTGRIHDLIWIWMGFMWDFNPSLDMNLDLIRKWIFHQLSTLDLLPYFLLDNPADVGWMFSSFHKELPKV